MKKSVLFSMLCVAGFSMTFAQVAPSAVSLSNSSEQSEELGLQTKAPVLLKSKLHAPVQAPQTRPALSAAYGRPDGLLKHGVNAEWNIAQPVLVGGAGYENKWHFKNLTTNASDAATYSWSISGNVFDGDPSNNNDLFVDLPIGTWSTPILTVTDGTSKSTYQYGTKVSLISGAKPTQQFLTAGLGENLPLTNADIHYGNIYAVFEKNHIMGSGDLSDGGVVFYSEKDGMTTLSGPIRSNGIVTYFDKPVTPLVISSISIPGFSKSVQPLTEDISMKLEIRKLDANGRVDMNGEPLISSTTNSTQVTQPIPSDAPEAFFLNFTFSVENEFGIPVDVDYILDQPFAVVVTGFSQTGCDFSVYCADAVEYERAGSSWLIMEDGTLGTYAMDKDYAKPRFDAYIQLNGMYPCLHLLNPTADIPREGGLAKFEAGGEEYSPQFISTFPGTGDNAIEIASEVPSWLSIVPDETYFEDQRCVIYVVEGEALPADVNGRRATILFRSHGIEKSLLIRQGPDAVSTVDADQYKVVRSGNNFVLSYPAGATSVTIVNALGQNVAQYDLSANGSMTVPATVLANGLNVFKFNGAGSIAVKAMN